MSNFPTVSRNLNVTNEGSPFPLRYWELSWYSFIFLTGAAGNLLVCLVMFKSNSVFRSTTFNMYLCSLAVADLLLALVVLPNYLLQTSIFNHPDGVWGDVMCKTITGDFFNFYLSDASECSLILISLERLRAVRKSVMADISDIHTSKKGAWLAIILAWLIPVVYGSPKIGFVFYDEREPIIGNYCTFGWKGKTNLFSQVYSPLILIITAIIPVIIFIYCFYKIRRCLLVEENRIASRIEGERNNFHAGYRYHECWQIVKRRHRTVRILMIATFVFIICWIPNKILFFIANDSSNDKGEDHHERLTWNSPVYQIGILIGFTGSCINPYLYACQSKEFRYYSKEAIKSLIPSCMRRYFKYRHFNNQTDKTPKFEGNSTVLEENESCYSYGALDSCEVKSTITAIHRQCEISQSFCSDWTNGAESSISDTITFQINGII